MNKSRPLFWTEHELHIDLVGPDGRFTVDVNKPFALVGNHPNADIPLKGKNVERRHLYLQVLNNQIYAIDFSTEKKSQRFHGNWLAPDQQLTVGNYQLQARLKNDTTATDDYVAPSHNPLSKRSTRPPHPRIICSSEDQSLGEYHLQRQLSVIGRSKASTFQFSTRSISDVHCILYLDGKNVWVIGLKSSQRTLIKGKAVRCARLKQNSTFQIGRVAINLQTNRSDNDSRSTHSDSTMILSDAKSNRFKPTDSAPSGDSFLLDSPLDSSHHSPEINLQSANRAALIEAEQIREKELAARELAVEITEEELLDHVRELDELREEFEITKTEFESNLKRQEQELDERNAQCLARESELSQQQMQLEDSRLELENQLAQQKSEQQKSQEVDKNQRALELAQAEFEQAKIEWETQQTEFETFQNESESGLQKRQAELAQKESQLAELESSIKQRQQELNSNRLETDSRLEQQRKTLAEHEARLQAKESELTQREMQLENSTRELENNRTSQESEEEKRKEFTQRQQALDLAEAEFKQQQLEWETQREQFENLQSQFESTRQKQSAELAEKKTRISELASALKQREQEAENTYEELSQLQSEIDAEQKQSKSKLTHLETLRKELDERQLEIDQHQAKLEAREQELDGKLKSLSQQSKAEHFELKQQWETARQELLNAETKIADLESRVQQLRSESDSLNDTVRQQRIELQDRETEKLNVGDAIRTLLNEQINRTQLPMESVESKDPQANIETLKQILDQTEHVSVDHTHDNLEKIAEDRKLLEQRQNELELAQAKLAKDRKELERFANIDLAQRNVLANMKRLEWEESFMGRLFGRFFRSGR